MAKLTAETNNIPTGSVVLVAKCPIAGAVKTRLARDIGEEGAASFARAMLCDVLEQVGRSVSFSTGNLQRLVLCVFLNCPFLIYDFIWVIGVYSYNIISLVYPEYLKFCYTPQPTIMDNKSW